MMPVQRKTVIINTVSAAMIGRRKVQMPEKVIGGDGGGVGHGGAHIQSGRWNLSQVLDAGEPLDEEDDEELIHAYPIDRYMGDGPRLRRTTRRPAFEMLQSGFILRITTSDPNRHPLPHPDLLTTHSAIMRVARAAGARSSETLLD